MTASEPPPTLVVRDIDDVVRWLLEHGNDTHRALLNSTCASIQDKTSNVTYANEDDDDSPVAKLDMPHVIAAIVLTIPSLWWIILPSLRKMHWGDVAYYSYVSFARIWTNAWSYVATSLRWRPSRDQLEEGDIGSFIEADVGMPLIKSTPHIVTEQNVTTVRRVSVSRRESAVNWSSMISSFRKSSVGSVSRHKVYVRRARDSTYSTDSSDDEDDETTDDTDSVERTPHIKFLRKGVLPSPESSRRKCDVIFASQYFHIDEDGSPEDNALLLVRRDDSTRAEVTITTVSDRLGAQDGHHFVGFRCRLVVFEIGQVSARVPLQTIHQNNWDSSLLFRVLVDDAPNGECRSHTEDLAVSFNCNDSRCAIVYIVNNDEFPRSHAIDQTLFRKDAYWPLRVFVFCRYVYDDLRIHIPSYFKSHFVAWYLVQFAFQGFYSSMLLPWIYFRLSRTVIPENRVSEALLLASIGLSASCVHQRVRYSFFGFWALGRFNSIRLIRFFHSIPFLHLQDPMLNGRFHKLFQNMEACVNNTWHAAMLTCRLIINNIFITIASVAFQRDHPLTISGVVCLIVLCILLTRLIQHKRKWPEVASFSDSERRETLISDEVDHLMGTRVIHATLGVTHQSTWKIDDGYAAYLHERNKSWCYIDHNFWSKYWSWSILVWSFVATSPTIVHAMGVNVNFDIMLYLMVLQGTVLSKLDDAIERFRYGLAQLDYLAETVGNPEYATYRSRMVDVTRDQRKYWERELAAIPNRPLATALRRRHVWNTIFMSDVSESELPSKWKERAIEKFVNCTAEITIGARLYGLCTDRFMNVQLLWLLSGHVLPKSGHIYLPPDLHVTLMPNSLDCMPIAGTLLDNLRLGCGDAESSGISDELIWTLCRKLGMREQLVAENPLVSQSSIRYSSVDMALAGLAQHLLMLPDLILINNPHCVTLQSLQALHLYINGKLLPNRRKQRKSSISESTQHDVGCSGETEGDVSRTAIVILPQRDMLQHCDLEIEISKSTPTTLSIQTPHRACGRCHSRRYTLD